MKRLLRLTHGIWGRDNPNSQSRYIEVVEIIFVLCERAETFGQEKVTEIIITYLDAFGNAYTSEFDFFGRIEKLSDTKYAEELK